MKGASRTKAEKEYQDRIASVGCICCLQDGIYTPHVSIHHIDGRTKPGAHYKVLSLCGPHHQQDDTSGVIAVHPNKARFQREYGSQYELLEQAKQIAGIC
jgi:hypothetical protein